MIFRYRARTATGSISTGTREAASEGAAINWIREQGWSPISIEAESSGISIRQQPGDGKKTSILQMELIPQKVTLKDKNVVFKQMATMINAGITIAATLDLLASQTENKSLAGALSGMRDAVNSGVTLAAAKADSQRCSAALRSRSFARAKRAVCST